MRQAFTLLEVVISVAIIALAMMLFSSAIIHYKTYYNWLHTKTTSKEELTKVYQILYADILASSSLNTVESGKYTVLKIQTSNSLYGLQNPTVMWYVLDLNKTLIRAESQKDFTIPITTNINMIFADIIANNCEEFFISAKQKAIFTNITLDNNQSIKFAIPVILE